jgi:hypothetical protein
VRSKRGRHKAGRRCDGTHISLHLGPGSYPNRGLFWVEGRAIVEALLTQATDADHWRAMAEEALVIAEEMTDAESKRSMLEIAAGYELLAHSAELREARRVPVASK